MSFKTSILFFSRDTGMNRIEADRAEEACWYNVGSAIYTIAQSAPRGGTS